MQEKVDPIISAKDLERAGILKARTALRMAIIGILPHYRFGERMHSVGFRRNEVVAAMRRDANGPSKSSDRNAGAA